MKKKTSMKSSSPKMLYGLIAFTILLLAIVGLFLFKKSQIPTPQSVRIIHNDWRTYRDNNLSFSIKYPENVVIYRTFREGGVEFAKENESSKGFNEVTTLSIYFRDGKNSELALQNECSKPCTEKYEPIILNNAIGIKTLGPIFQGTNYYLTDIKKSVTVRMSIIEKGVTKQDINDFKEMINTFEFID